LQIRNYVPHTAVYETCAIVNYGKAVNCLIVVLCYADSLLKGILCLFRSLKRLIMTGKQLVYALIRVPCRSLSELTA